MLLELFSCNLCDHRKPVRVVVDDVSSLVCPESRKKRLKKGFI